MLTLESIINYHAKYKPTATAVVFEHREYRWQEFAGQVNKAANALLDSGVKKSDKVATILPNSIELITLYWAVTSIGAVIVPLSNLLQKSGIIFLLQNSDASVVFLETNLYSIIKESVHELPNVKKIIVVDAENLPSSEVQHYANFVVHAKSTPPKLEQEIHQDDLFNISFSSGTTGTPKGIEHTHLIRSHYCFHFGLAFRMKPESVVLHSGSIAFNGAWLDLMPTFYLGAAYILQKSFAAEEVIAAIAKYKVTHMIMVPSQIIALLQSPEATFENLKSLEMILTVGAPLNQKYKESLVKLLPNRFYELYGLTEGFMSILDIQDNNEKLASVGKPPVGFETRVVDDHGKELPCYEIGEVIGKSPIAMRGYYKQPELTAQTIKNGWIYTGDLGYLDEDGFLFLTGRKKDMIISGGINIYPKDIEDILGKHEAVLETAVVGIPSEKWGEAPIAFVLLKPTVRVQKDDLLQWINQNVDSKHQRLRDIVFVEELPRNVAGKILKDALKAQYAEDASASLPS